MAKNSLFGKRFLYTMVLAGLLASCVPDVPNESFAGLIEADTDVFLRWNLSL